MDRPGGTGKGDRCGEVAGIVEVRPCDSVAARVGLSTNIGIFSGIFRSFGVSRKY